MNEISLRLNECITKKRIQHNILEKENKKTEEYCDHEIQMNALFFEFQKTKRDYDQLENVYLENEMTQIIPEFKLVLKLTLDESFKRISRLIETLEYEIEILIEMFEELMIGQDLQEKDLEEKDLQEKDLQEKDLEEKDLDEKELHERINETVDKFIDKEDVDCTLDEIKQKEPKTKKRKLAIKTKSLSKKQLLETCVCFVCLENHFIIECVTTSCNHSYGKECFLTEIEKKGNKCPLCSIQNPTYFEYRNRMYKKKEVEKTKNEGGLEHEDQENKEVEYLIG
jgi:hypothetical protein